MRSPARRAPAPSTPATGAPPTRRRRVRSQGLRHRWPGQSRSLRARI